MSNRKLWLVAVAIVGAATLTGCSSITALFGGGSSTTKRVTSPQAGEKEEWNPLDGLLPQTDLPAGWTVGGVQRAVEGERVDSANTPGICALTLDAPFQADMTAGATVTLERPEREQQLIIGAATAPNAEKTMASVGKQLADCPSVTEFKTGDLSTSVKLSNFSDKIDGHGGKTACRSYTMQADKTATFGDFCVMAKKNFVTFTMSAAPTAEQKVPAADFTQITDLQAKHLFK